MTKKELKNKINTLNTLTKTPKLLKQVLNEVSEGTKDKTELKNKINKIQVFSSNSQLVKNVLYKLADNAPEKEDKPKFEYVDLGLPSGTLWAKCNVGAETETEDGGVFQWGDVVDKRDENVWTWNYKWYSDYGWAKYNDTDNKTVLDLEDDVAHVIMRGKWCMPNLQDLQELLDNTNMQEVNDYNGSGVKGVVISNKNDSSKYIFIPYFSYRNGNYVSRSLLNIISKEIMQGDPAVLAGENSRYYVSVLSWAIDANRGYGFTIRGVLHK